MYEIESIIEERLARLRRQYKLDADFATRHRIDELTLIRDKLRKAGIIARPKPKHKALPKDAGGSVPELD